MLQQFALTLFVDDNFLMSFLQFPLFGILIDMHELNIEVNIIIVNRALLQIPRAIHFNIIQTAHTYTYTYYLYFVTAQNNSTLIIKQQPNTSTTRNIIFGFEQVLEKMIGSFIYIYIGVVIQQQSRLQTNIKCMAKFDWIPYLEGKYLTYYQWFAVLGSTAMLVLAFLSFVVYLGLSKIKFHQLQFQPGPRVKPWIEKTKTVFFNATFVFLALVPLICAALDVTYMIVGIIGQSAILSIMVILNNGRRKWDWGMHQTQTKSLTKAFLDLAFQIDPATKKKIIQMVIISTLGNLFMYRTCLCFYNIQIGYYNPTLGFGINTYLTRLVQLERSCPPGPPCQMYTTVPENPEEAFFLNVHTHIDVESITVFYQQFNTPNKSHWLNVSAFSFKYDGLQWKSARRVHSALIYGLKPNTKYLTKVFYDNQYWTNAIYKTLPSDPSTPIRMINAGDSGYTQGAVNLSKIVATLNPDIFFMGGDIAYDDNMPACSYTWDSFLGMYGQITATLGYMMPILVTVGNHDAGLNELPGVNITIDNRGPAFLIYFPQHYDRNQQFQVIKQVPPVHRRRTVMDFTFSNVHYLLLDSGYLHAFDGWQKKYMINAFERNRDKIKFVNYHVPIYSVCEAFDSNPERFLFALFHWVPNFDKYKVMTVFENHVHSFKRTKPLVGSSPSDKGTVYVGDGAYGAIISQLCHPDASLGIFDTFSKSNNFWLSEIRSDRVEHIAYDSRGRIIDNFTQYAADYKLRQVKEDQVHEQEPTVTITKGKTEEL